MLTAPKIGQRVVAGSDFCAHTAHGVVAEVVRVAPVALVAFDCGCRAYVPARRLDRERVGAVTLCAHDGCRRGEWPAGAGLCITHKFAVDRGSAAEPSVRGHGRAGQEQPFDSLARPSHMRTSARSPRVGRAIIDGRGTTIPRAGLPGRGGQADRSSGVLRSASSRGASGDAPRPGSGERPAASSAPAAPRRRGGPVSRWSREECIRAAHAWHEKYGRWPTSLAWAKEGPENPCACRVKRLFGSFQKFAEETGFTPRYRRDWTREEAIAAIQRYARERGEVPGFDDLNGARRPAWMPPATTIRRLFGGTFGDAIRAAGLTPRRPGRKRPKAHV